MAVHGSPPACGRDLAVAAVYQDLDWYTAEDYTAFARAYGHDLRAWEGYDTLADIRRLRMTAWLTARTGRKQLFLGQRHP